MEIAVEFACNSNVFTAAFNLLAIFAINRTIFEKLNNILSWDNIVYRDQLQFGSFKNDFQSSTDNTARTIDRYSYHLLPSLRLVTYVIRYRL